MNQPLKLILIAGARPNFMKIAPLIHAIERHNARQSVVSAHSSVVPPPISDLQSPISYRLIHTGQHYDEKMSEVFFRELGIPKPDSNLEVGSGSHAAQTAEIMKRVEPVLLNAFVDAPSDSDRRSPIADLGRPSPDGHPLRLDRGEPDATLAHRMGEGLGVRALGKVSNSRSSPPPASGLRSPISALQTPARPVLPDWLVVVGDVNSTMACALVASKLGIKVAHVEAGLRSFDRTMPEEINRIVTDAIADLLLTPSEDANENLRHEGVPEEKIRLVGNVMIDSLVANLPKARASTILQQLSLQPGNFVYVTLHRPSNVDHRESLGRIMAELDRLAAKLPVVLPIHPRTRKMMHDYGLTWNGAHGIKVVEPLGYHDSLCLTENARLILTDSGGLQEESTWFRTPCLTLRPNTERPITVTVGSNRLTSLDSIALDTDKRLAGENRSETVPAFWDGQAAGRICDSLLTWGLDPSGNQGVVGVKPSPVSAP